MKREYIPESVRRQHVLDAITDKGDLVEAIGPVIRHRNIGDQRRFLRRMMQDGLLFCCYVPAQKLGISLRTKVVVYFKTAEARDEYARRMGQEPVDLMLSEPLARTQLRRERVLQAMDDTGQLISDIGHLTGLNNIQNQRAFMLGMVASKHIFQLTCLGSAIGKAPRRRFAVYFKTEEAMKRFEEEYKSKLKRYKEEVIRADMERAEAIRLKVRAERKAARLAAQDAERAARRELRERERAEREAAQEAARQARAEARRIAREEREARRQAERERKAAQKAMHVPRPRQPVERPPARPRVVKPKVAKSRVPTQKQADTAQMLARIRSQEAAEFENRKRTAWQAQPAIIPPTVKITIAPPPPDRLAVEAPSTGGFAALRPGQYAFEASTCAAKAAGGTK